MRENKKKRIEAEMLKAQRQEMKKREQIINSRETQKRRLRERAKKTHRDKRGKAVLGETRLEER